MLKKIIVGLGLVIVVFLIVVATRPADYQVERKITISAPAAVIFSKLNDFRNWQEWSPWEKLDPKMKKAYEGPTSGVGAIYSWDGNKDVGKGKMTILESRLNEQVVIKLEFFEPWAATSTTTLSISPAEASSYHLTWRMNGHNNFIGKAFSLFMSMDKMIGKDFEKGLSQLKVLSEKPIVLP